MRCFVFCFFIFKGLYVYAILCNVSLHLSWSQISEERDGSLVWDESRMKRGQCPSAKSSIEFSTKMNLRGEHNSIHDCVPVDKEQAKGGTCKEFCSDDSIKKLPTNGAFCSVEKV